MKCPSCSHENSKVIDSRVTDGGVAIRRRRECEKCEFRFTTFERMQTTNLMIEKKDGLMEPYDREKLEKGILTACGKRPISIEKIREKISELEEKWGKEKIVRSGKIGEDVIEMLRDIDEVAFIRFASVYRQFQDMETFKTELEKIFKQEK
ncbi:transcriptional regulator NrdR [Candidatus Gracilibacteria bacterium]|nr:transcriptional regulator NrdR [Candidatus Gracilibacteria bacterium]